MSLFNTFRGQTQQPQVNNNPFSNFANTMQQFNSFRQNFQGDPKQAVMSLLESGQMSQDQFNQLSQMANQFTNMLGR